MNWNLDFFAHVFTNCYRFLWFLSYTLLQVEKNLEAYKAQFDIVLVHDESMDLTNALLHKIL